MFSKTLTALFTVGVAYGLGIVVALVVCTATSGGHFSPAVTLVHVLFNGFPPTKAVRLARVSSRNGPLNLYSREDISLPRFSVAFLLAGSCIGNIIHLSRSAHMSPLLSSAEVVFQQGLLTYSQAAEAALTTAGVYDTANFSSLGPAGIFALYANPADPLGLVFLNEFVSVRSRVHIADHD
jgi:hypothetical protein